MRQTLGCARPSKALDGHHLGVIRSGKADVNIISTHLAEFEEKENTG